METQKIGVVMGSQSDWPVMEHAVKQLEAFGVSYEAKVVSAHRTPDLLFEYADNARQRGDLGAKVSGHEAVPQRRVDSSRMTHVLRATTTTPWVSTTSRNRYRISVQ